MARGVSCRGAARLAGAFFLLLAAWAPVGRVEGFFVRQPPLRTGAQHRRLLSVAAEQGIPPLPGKGKGKEVVDKVRPLTKVKKPVDWGQTAEDVALRDRLFANDARGIVLFDGICHFCATSVNIFMALDGGDAMKGSFRYAALQGPTGQALLRSFGMDPEHFNTVVLVEPDRISTKSDAIIRIALKLKEPIPALATVGGLLPLDVRDGMYDWVSEHRQIFGERDQCRIPEDHEIERFLE